MGELDVEIKYQRDGKTVLWFLCFGAVPCMYHFVLMKDRKYARRYWPNPAEN